MRSKVADIAHGVHRVSDVRGRIRPVDELFNLPRKVTRFHLGVVTKRMLQTAPAEGCGSLRTVSQDQTCLLVVISQLWGHLRSTRAARRNLRTYQVVQFYVGQLVKGLATL